MFTFFKNTFSKLWSSQSETPECTDIMKYEPYDLCADYTVVMEANDLNNQCENKRKTESIQKIVKFLRENKKHKTDSPMPNITEAENIVQECKEDSVSKIVSTQPKITPFKNKSNKKKRKRQRYKFRKRNKKINKKL